ITSGEKIEPTNSIETDCIVGGFMMLNHAAKSIHAVRNGTAAGKPPNWRPPLPSGRRIVNPTNVRSAAATQVSPSSPLPITSEGQCAPKYTRENPTAATQRTARTAAAIFHRFAVAVGTTSNIKTA